ncbi:hypothetical protein GF367_03120 [Candidatus Woesearchaeota archaeon]|nr:hypothetical protein [Candidatus Woesearchaeota archaeon]
MVEERRMPSDGFVLAVLVLLAVFFVLTPFTARSLQGNNALLGEQSHFHLGLAQNMLEPSSYHLQDVTPTLFNSLVAGILIIANPMLTSKLLPIILGVASVILFFLTAQRVLGDMEERSLAGLLFIISPLFIVVFTTLTPASLVLFLSLLCWWLYDRSPVLSGVTLSLLVGVHATAFIVTAVLLVAYGLLRGSWKHAAVSGAIGLFLMVLLDAFFGFVAGDALIMSSSFNDFFVSLGANFGYSFFLLFLAAVGVIAAWSKERRQIVASLIIGGVFVFSFSDMLARVLLVPLVAMLAGKGVLVLLRRPWTVRSIRNITLFLVGLSLLFTLVFTISGQVKAEPTMEKLEALRFLHTSPPDAVVLSSPDNGVLIERLGRRQAFLDNAQQDQERWSAAQQVFLSYRMGTTVPLLQEYGITYVFVDERMRDGGVWTYEEQGLLFLLKYDDRFVKLYDAGSNVVYRFTG